MSRKTDKADLRKSYPIYVELGLIAALGILILAFRLDLRSQEPDMAVVEEQEEIQMEEVQQTEQVEQPPPPPKPPVPVEVPNEEELEDQDIDFDAALDLNEDLSSNEPPPPPDDEEEEEEPEQEVFVAVEDQPQMLPDQQTAMRELQQQIEYPEMAKRAGVEGRVIVQFIVDENGNVTDPQVIQGKGAGLDKEALRVIQTLKFEPGKQRGQPVKVRMAIPINFALN